jgi:hypothetical protein
VSSDPTQPPPGGPGSDPSGREPTEEEMRAALEAELKRVRVDQVVLEAAISILNVAVMRAGLVPGSEAERDLDQVAVGIEAVRGLLPVVEQLAGEQARPIRDALSQLQMAYVRGMEEQQGGAAAAEGGPQAPPAAEPKPRAGDTGPAQRSGRLWVPGQ